MAQRRNAADLGAHIPIDGARLAGRTAMVAGAGSEGDQLGTGAATAVLFAGDDVTDEDAFAALLPGDVGIKCGAGPTAASFSVPGIPDVARALAQVASLRRRG